MIPTDLNQIPGSNLCFFGIEKQKQKKTQIILDCKLLIEISATPWDSALLDVPSLCYSCPFKNLTQKPKFVISSLAFLPTTFVSEISYDTFVRFHL